VGIINYKGFSRRSANADRTRGSVDKNDSKVFESAYVKRDADLTDRVTSFITRSSVGMLEFVLGNETKEMEARFVEEEQKMLRSVGSLKTSIVQIKTVLPNESVGYGRTFASNQEMKIAVLPIGYADGFRRSLSNGKGKVFINGKACPVVGRVCMDMTMVDISDLDVLEGDEAIIFNEDHSIIDFANDCDTIAYEVLTNIPQRVKRIIVNEA
jgi:alanine racemase